MASTASFYQVLGLPASANGDEIKAAYRRLARTCHPDVVAASRRDASGSEFMKLHTAYSTLSDPNKRAVYDRDLFIVRHRFGCLSATGAPAGGSMSSKSTYSSGYPRRTWETDQCW